jgi:tetratricopeptide (TPR) repeat protein
VLTNLIASAALAAIATQPADPAADFAAVATRLDKAVSSDDTQGTKDARAACMRLLAAAPSGPKGAMVRYTIAYADWRLAFSPAIPAAEQNSLLTDAEEQLGQAIKIDASFAEAYGLLSMVYGSQIAKNADLGPTLGMALGDTLGRALSIEPDSPRLLMMQGITLMHTPAEYGGDPKQAEAIFARALQMFDKEPAAKAWPTWGRLDTHVWLGQALAGRGDIEGARAQYQTALTVAPGSLWAKGMLDQLK